MALSVVQLIRVFEDNGVQLADPAPGLGVQEAVRVLASTGRPHLLTCEIRGPVQRDNQAVYTLHRAVGTKGLLPAMTAKNTRHRVLGRQAANQALKSYQLSAAGDQERAKPAAALAQLLTQSSDKDARVAMPSEAIPWTC